MRINTYSQIQIIEKWISIFLEEENNERERQKWRKAVGFVVCGEKKRKKEREKHIGKAETARGERFD